MESTSAGHEPDSCACVYERWYQCLPTFPMGGPNAAASPGEGTPGTSSVATEQGLVEIIPPTFLTVLTVTFAIVVGVLVSRWALLHVRRRTLDLWYPRLRNARHRKLILPPGVVVKPQLLQKRSFSTLMRAKTRAFLSPSKSKRDVKKENLLKSFLNLDALPEGSTPLIVFVNKKSGGQKGEFLYEQLLSNLSPYQLFDVSSHNPMWILQLFGSVPGLRVLVCGGDGTISWVLNTIDKLKLDPPPPVAVLPLGTGNDLARMLGWGPGYNRDSNVAELLCEVKDSHRVVMDRWRARVAAKPAIAAPAGKGKKPAAPNGETAGSPAGEGAQGKESSASHGGKQPVRVFNNYFGIGVDATTALQFHETRNLYPEWFFSRNTNKLWYTLFGAKEAVYRSCKGLASRVRLTCDGVEQDIPEGAEGIILLNINSFAGGCRMWVDKSSYASFGDVSLLNGRGEEETEDGLPLLGLGAARAARQRWSAASRFKPSSMQDGMLDVVAVNGSFHLGEMNVGLARPIQICQGRCVEISTNEPVAMQVDGEPWVQPPCDISISLQGHAQMLRRTADTSGEAALLMQELLSWASETGVVDAPQYSALLTEMSRRFT